jgi:5'-nucleotidase / UDP-sugar diphosphatase
VNVRDKTLSGSSPDHGTTLTDERTAIRQQIGALEKRGVNKIIVVSHLGYERDKNWLTQIEGIDVVIGAHSHTLLASQVKPVISTTKGNYPEIDVHQKTGKPICIVHAWKFGRGVGRLRVEFDDDGDVVMCGGNYMIPYGTNANANDQDRTTVNKYLKGLGPTFVQTQQNTQALKKLRQYTDQMNGQLFFDTVVTKQAVPLCNEAIPGEGKSELCSKEDTLKHGGAACQVVAQAMLDQTKEAHVAIQNAGGCRADIVAGDFTYGQAMELLPYSDLLVTLNMTGFQIRTVLEQALDLALGHGDSSGSYPYASGLRFNVNASEEAGRRISDLQMNARLAEGTWNDIDPQGYYTVVTNSFLAAGRDGYMEFANAADRDELPITYLDAFLAYIKENEGIDTPDLTAMSTQSFTGEGVTERDDADGNVDDSIEELWSGDIETTYDVGSTRAPKDNIRSDTPSRPTVLLPLLIAVSMAIIGFYHY